MKKNLFIIMWFIIIYTGNLSHQFEILPINYPTLIILILFIFSLVRNPLIILRKSDKQIYWYAFINLICLMINFQLMRPENSSYLFGYVIPIKMMLVYIVLCNIYNYSEYNSNVDEDIFYSFKLIVYLGLISGIIALFRFTDTFNLAHLINELWPLKTDRTMFEWGRLLGTMSGTNGTGTFYGLLGILSYYLFSKNKKIVYLLFMIFYFILMFLSSSLTAISAFAITLLVVIFDRSDNKSRRRLLLFIIIGLIIYMIISNTIFAEFFSLRARRLDNSTLRNTNDILPNSINAILPRNIVARIGYWASYINILSQKIITFLFGYGPGGTLNSNIYNHGVPESFYFRVFNDQGITGIIFLSYLIISYWNKAKIIKHTQSGQFLRYILIYYIFAAISNETIYYSANSELFILILVFIKFKEREVYGVFRQLSFNNAGI